MPVVVDVQHDLRRLRLPTGGRRSAARTRRTPWSCSRRCEAGPCTSARLLELRLGAGPSDDVRSVCAASLAHRFTKCNSLRSEWEASGPAPRRLVALRRPSAVAAVARPVLRSLRVRRGAGRERPIALRRGFGACSRGSRRGSRAPRIVPPAATPGGRSPAVARDARRSSSPAPLDRRASRSRRACRASSSCRRRSRRRTRRRRRGSRDFASACGACSRDEPQPKLRSESRMVAPGEARVVRAGAPCFAPSSSKRTSSNEVLAEAVEGDALQEARRDDAVGVDVVAGDGRRPRPRTWTDFGECHRSPSLSAQMPEHFAGVGDLAAHGRRGDHDRAHQQGAAGRAALAALEVAVRRRRAELVADRACRGSWPGTSSSPASRHSKPASRKIWSSPSASRRAGRRPASRARRARARRARPCWPLR